ncbi:MAG: hypothetical protein M1376_11300, partial [Planctomycetes bacterium]|nr:hypothetical protein [Planctomycetota bacterium]
PLQKEYSWRDGRYYLSVLPVTLRGPDGKERTIALEDVTGLKIALSQERTTTHNLARQLRAFEGIDDPQAARNALAQVREWARAGSGEKYRKQLELTEQQIENHYRNTIETLTRRSAAARQENEQLLAQMHRLVIDGAAAAALLRQGVLPEAQDLLAEQIRQRCRCRRVEEAGRKAWRIEVLDAQGNVRITNASGSTDSMGMEELVGEMKAGQYAFAFQGPPVRGQGGQNRPGQAENSKPSPVERLKLVRRAGREADGSN